MVPQQSAKPFALLDDCIGAPDLLDRLQQKVFESLMIY
jgi:hypothetical protein